MGYNLYYASGSRFVTVDPVRGIEESHTEFTPKYLVVAKGHKSGKKKFLDYLNKGRKRWEVYEFHELTPGDSLPVNRGKSQNPNKLEVIV